MNKLFKVLSLALVFLSILCWAGEDRGLGGTGKWQEEDRGLGGTGVIGTITQFGSIWVNGLEIEFDKNTHIEVDDQVGSRQDLRLGEQVKVLAIQKGQSWYADTILVTHAIIGRVQEADNDTIQIQGIRITADNRSPGQWPVLHKDDYVKVSGYFQGKHFYATDIEPSVDNHTWQIVAPVEQGESGDWSVGGLPIPNAVLEAKANEYLTLRGTYTDDGSRLDFVRHEQAVPFAQSVDHYSIERRNAYGSEIESLSRQALEKQLNNDSNERFENPHSRSSDNVWHPSASSREASNSGIFSTQSKASFPLWDLNMGQFGSEHLSGMSAVHGGNAPRN